MVLYECVCAGVRIFKQCVPCSYHVHFIHFEPMFAKNALKAIFHTVHLKMSMERPDMNSVQEVDCLMTFVGDSPLRRGDHADHLFSHE